MIRYAVYGAGGFGKEVMGMLEMLKKQGHNFEGIGFIDDFKKKLNTVQEDAYDDILIAIADPVAREHVVAKLNKSSYPLTSLIDPSVIIHDSVKIGKGSIVCSGVKFTVGITLGNFVIVNLNSTIGHDVSIGDYCSIMPSANISGSVTLGKSVLVGSGAVILQGLTIGDRVKIGAGAVVTRSVPQDVTVVGMPARIKK